MPEPKTKFEHMVWKLAKLVCNNCEHPKGSRGACADCIYKALLKAGRICSEDA